jgi:hypothetical protein
MDTIESTVTFEINSLASDGAYDTFSSSITLSLVVTETCHLKILEREAKMPLSLLVDITLLTHLYLYEVYCYGVVWSRSLGMLDIYRLV